MAGADEMDLSVPQKAWLVWIRCAWLKHSKGKVDMVQEELQPWSAKPDAVELACEYLGFTDKE